MAIVRHLFLSENPLGLSSHWLDRYCAAILAATLEHYHAVCESVKSVILANTYILARVMLGATLTNDNVASLNSFTPEVLQTESF